MNKPLAAALRPESLEDVCGQQHLLNKDAVFRRAIENGAIQNMTFYGPSGVGKTTVAGIIAKMADKKLFKLNFAYKFVATLTAYESITEKLTFKLPLLFLILFLCNCVAFLTIEKHFSFINLGTV